MTRSLSVSSRVSTLALAVALVAGPTPVAAQSLQGTGAFTNPAHGSIDNSVPNTTTVTVNQDQSVINWTPSDNGIGGGAINFQPQDTVAIFQNNPDLVGDFAVLNRINVADNSRAVALNGTIQGLVNGQTGGAIYFYSPSGFVVGATAVINVGSLVLSASPISFNPTTGSFIDTSDGSKVSFGQADNPTAQINTVAGSQISALNEGSYVALVAPRVSHSGTINVNGGAALVGAEAATITFRTSGLFDITVDVGTTDANGVGVNGDIGGPASTGTGDNHRVYMVAVPKNDALTMAIGGGSNLGFDIAGAAEVIDNAVVLSAGHDISFGDIVSNPSAASGADANISIAETNFTSAVYARADGDMVAGVVDQTLTFASDASLRGRDTAHLDAGSGGVVTVGGDLTISANADGATGQSASAGSVTLQAFAGGQLTVAGTTVLRAVGTGGFSNTVGTPSGDGTGGVILVQSTTGGDMTLSGGLDADASGYGGSFFGAIDGGDGFGGTVNVFTSGGSTMDVTGAAYLRANGQGGMPSDCTECGGVGGVGDAGTINVQAHTGPNNSMSFGDVLYMWADGTGGYGASGGFGIGGNVNFSSSSSSLVTVASDVAINANGTGGDGSTTGGIGRGGAVQAFVSGGTMTLSADLTQSVVGFGGHSPLGTGGNGRGGSGQAFANSAGIFTVAGFALIDTSGYGGSGATGGNGQGALPGSGGGAYFSASTGGLLQLSTDAYLISEGRGGFSDVGNGGIGQGGHVEAYANNATVSVGRDLTFDADGEGGSTIGAGSTTGAGNGGEVFLQALLGGTFTIGRNMSATAEGIGGSPNFGTYSGNGTGGEINVNARDGNSLMDITGSATLDVDGFAGYSSECSFGCSAGGIGQGGDIFIGSSGSISTGINRLQIGGTLEASADGWGGESAVIDPDTNTTINGGDGIGGQIFLFDNGGNSVSVDGEVDLIAIGWGGYDSANLVAGDGQGGQIFLTSDNAATNVLSFGSAVHLNVSGHGGDSGQVANGDGGDGTGGVASVAVRGGAMTVDGELSVFSMGFGGDTFGGIGGDGTGNTARINAAGGDLTVNGTAYADASGEGGTGMTGGNGTGGGDFELNVGGAHIFAKNGDLVINGSAVSVSDGIGGDGSFGGGDGGNGTGGWASLHSANGDISSSSVTVQGVESSAFVSASGIGGDGGEGLAGSDGSSGNVGGDGGTGGAGGDGGIGSGGRAAITAAAGNGTMNVGIAVTQATGTGGIGGIGGIGGAGGIGTIGQGGNGGAGGGGGAGGAAFGGIINVGTESGSAEAVAINQGVGNYGSVEMDSSAEGGMGGDGGLGGAAGSGTPNGLAGAAGNGGNGGDAEGGIAVLLVRGSTVNVTLANMVADATGGDGGFGAVRGAGGTAESDEIGVLVTSRNINAAQGGTLNAGTIVGTSTSIGGAGTGPGLSTMEGGSGVVIENSVATIGSLDFTITADIQIADIATDSIAIVNSTVDITGDFSFVTDGVASILVDDNTPLTTALTADSFTVTARNFIHDPERTIQASVGTIDANSIALNTLGDLIVDANLVSTSALNLVAPGLIDIEDASSGSDITLDAGGSINGGTLTAAGLVDAAAGGDIGLNLVNAGSNITMQSTGGSILTNGMNAGGLVDLQASIDVGTGDITSDGSITILADTGDISTGDLLALSGVDLQAAGDIAFGDISAFIVNLDAGGSIAGGSIDSETDISAAAGADIDLADLFAGGITVEGFTAGNVVLSAGGAISTGVIDAFGSVEADAGDDIATDSIDALTFVQLLAGLDVLTGSIDAGDRIDIFTTDGDIQTADLTGTIVDLAAEIGGIQFGAVNADILDFEAGGAVSGGNITTTAHVVGEAGGAIQLGDISAGLPIDEDFSVGIASGTSISVGDVTAPGNIGFATFGNLTTGDLSAGALIMTLVGGDITVGSMSTADAFGRIFMADSQMYVDAGGLDDNFDPALVFLTDMIPTGGSVTVGGTVDTSLLEIAAGGLVTLNGDVTTDGATLMSGDLALASGVTVSGSTSLYSLNSQGTFIGDGLTGPGYMLSNAEFNAFQGVSMEVRPDLGAAALLFLGDLNINSAITEVALAIEDADDNDLGTIRVVGDVRMNNANGELFFESETFQLDAATGSIVISADGTTPGGELIIAANNIHVAEGSILDRLAEDPQYDGYQDDLNAPASVQRPNGVIRAGTVSIEFGDTPADLYTLYVQNMGTAATPAGFVITDMNLGDDGEAALPAGSIDLIINGQIITATGTLTGIDVRDLLVQGRDLTPFTDNSTINGCLLAGECGDVVVPPEEPPVPPGFQPSPGIQKEITLVKDNLLPPPDFGNEDFIDDNDEETEDGATSPIVPPDPLFDTSQLGEGSDAAAAEFGTSMRSNPGLVRPGDVDDPVSGSGNPGLMETTAGPPSKEENQQ